MSNQLAVTLSKEFEEFSSDFAATASNLIENEKHFYEKLWKVTTVVVDVAIIVIVDVIVVVVVVVVIVVVVTVVDVDV